MRYKEIHNKYCPRCGATDNLYNYTHRKNKDGDEVFYYLCNPCNAKRRRVWYNNGNQQKAQDHNTTYRHKKQQT